MSTVIVRIEDAITQLGSSMRRDDYKGYDPYDALTSPLMRLPLLRSSHRLRFYIQQAVKRTPFNIRPLQGIPKGENPVTLALALQSFVELDKAGSTVDFKQKSSTMLNRLVAVKSSGFAQACWGYEFPWEARYATIGTHQPTIVATGIISNALFHYWSHTGEEEARQLILSSCSFAESCLKRTYDENEDFLFSYSPFDRECVLNASMKATRLLSQGYHISKNNDWRLLAQKSASRVARLQRPDGAWPYSLRSTGAKVDNYHTGYVLDCLDEYIRMTGDETHAACLKKGFNYYVSHFIEEDGQPRFYDDSKWPADCTAGGQTLLTLVRFGDIGMAAKTALWMIDNLQSPGGYFYYRKNATRTDRRHYMRWSDAWMLAGLTTVYRAMKEANG